MRLTPLSQSVSSLVTLPGWHSDHTLLNVVRSKGPGRVRDAVLVDNLETRLVPEEEDTFTLDDFDIGRSVSLGGREVLIYDCDEATRRYFRENFSKGA